MTPDKNEASGKDSSQAGADDQTLSGGIQRLQLYPWQKECLHIWKANGFHGIVNVVTGAGKTILALAASAYLKAWLAGSPHPEKLCVRIVVPSVPLALQWADSLKKSLPSFGVHNPQYGFYYSSRKDRAGQEYMIYVLNSARQVLARHILADMQKGYHVLLIADECHHCASPENRRIFDFLRDDAAAACRPGTLRQYHSLGLSATPCTGDPDDVLTASLGKEIYNYSFTAAARDGHVSNFSIYQVALSFSAAELGEYMDISDKMTLLFSRLIKDYPYLKHTDRSRMFAILRTIADQDGEDSPAAIYLNLSYKRKSVSCMAESRSSCTISLISLLDPAAKILVFGERISQAEQVYQALSARYPGRVGRYHSQMTAQAKKNTLSAYREGSLRILVSCRGLDEGVDVPEASVGIVLSGSAVNRQRIQRLGRILRRREGKSAACLYYLYVRESSEDSIYLENPDGAFPVCNLSYSAPDHAFSHPAYEALAARLLDDGVRRGLDTGQLKELRLCLLAGLVRADWLESPDICSANIRLASDRREKNYWICMKKMAQGFTDPHT